MLDCTTVEVPCSVKENFTVVRRGKKVTITTNSESSAKAMYRLALSILEDANSSMDDVEMMDKQKEVPEGSSGDPIGFRADNTK
jgi:hypothetical protein